MAAFLTYISRIWPTPREVLTDITRPGATQMTSAYGWYRRAEVFLGRSTRLIERAWFCDAENWIRKKKTKNPRDTLRAFVCVELATFDRSWFCVMSVVVVAAMLTNVDLTTKLASRFSGFYITTATHLDGCVSLAFDNPLICCCLHGSTQEYIYIYRCI